MIRKKSALLWEVNGPETGGDSFLFGTMHVKDARAFGRREVVYGKIAACEYFGTEIALDQIPPFAPDTFQLPAGQSLDQLLPPKKYRKLKRIVQKSSGLNLDQLRRLKPLVISNLMDEQILENEMPEALDRHLWNYARRLGKECIGVETVHEQIELLRQIPVEQQLRSLLSLAGSISNQRKRIRTMTRAYEEGDIYRIYQMARRGSGQLRKPMIFERNRLMADRLAAILPESTIFFAVGAGHLAGGKGLIRLLKQRGFRLRPVC